MACPRISPPTLRRLRGGVAAVGGVAVGARGGIDAAVGGAADVRDDVLTRQRVSASPTVPDGVVGAGVVERVAAVVVVPPRAAPRARQLPSASCTWIAPLHLIDWQLAGAGGPSGPSLRPT